MSEHKKSEKGYHRAYERTQMRAVLKIWRQDDSEQLVKTRDISDGGVFVVTDSVELKIGERITGQVQGLPMEAPKVAMEVVRSTDEGVGLRFVDERADTE